MLITQIVYKYMLITQFYQHTVKFFTKQTVRQKTIPICYTATSYNNYFLQSKQSGRKLLNVTLMYFSNIKLRHDGGKQPQIT